MHPESRMSLLNSSKLLTNWKSDDDISIWQHNFIVKYFWSCRVSLIKFSYWSKFHVNIITGSGIFLLWPEMEKSEKFLSEFFAIPGDWVKDIIFDTNVSDESYWICIAKKLYFLRFFEFRLFLNALSAINPKL